MKKKIILFIILSIFSIFADQQKQLFKNIESPFTSEYIVTNPQALQQIAKATLAFIKKYELLGRTVVPGLLLEQGVSLDDVKKTLNFIIFVIENDKGKKYQRILDSDFLNRHFKIIQWNPYKKNSVGSDNHIRLTKYLVFEFPGSDIKTEKYSCALYETPENEKNLSLEEKKRREKELLIFKYTKQEILNGALDHNKTVKPLAWVTRDALEEALMQGTVSINLPDGISKILNVDEHNNIAYEPSINDKKQQKRYWYFKEIDKNSFAYCKAHSSNVMFAGDIKNLGIGKIIAIRYKNFKTKKNEIRLGILADTGGAFENNLCQLDYFVGLYRTKLEFNTYIQKLPEVAEAFFLVKK